VLVEYSSGLAAGQKAIHCPAFSGDARKPNYLPRSNVSGQSDACQIYSDGAGAVLRLNGHRADDERREHAQDHSANDKPYLHDGILRLII
jgi:hypothetical protein